MAQAKKQNTKRAPAAKPKPIPMVKLADGGERPETAADRRAIAQMKKAEARKPDGARAFDIASGMEEELSAIERLMHALRLMASSDLVRTDPNVSGAMFAIADGIEEPLHTAQEKREKIFDLTWGYRFAEQPKAPAATPAATVAELDETIVALKAARARAKQAARAQA